MKLNDKLLDMAKRVSQAYLLHFTGVPPGTDTLTLPEHLRGRQSKTQLGESTHPSFSAATRELPIPVNDISPLRCSRGCGVHGEVPDGALLQVFLLPLGHVGFQSQDPLLLLPHQLHQRRGIVLREAVCLVASLPLPGKTATDTHPDEYRRYQTLFSPQHTA